MYKPDIYYKKLGTELSENNLSNLFVNYEVAEKLKELDFDCFCFAFYLQTQTDKSKVQSYNRFEEMNIVLRVNGTENTIFAPIFQQAVNWLEEKYNLHVDRVWYNDQHTPPRWVYHVDHKYAGSDYNKAILRALTIIKQQNKKS